MTDEFEKLSRALKAAPPPSAEARAAALAQAMKNFDDLAQSRQGSPEPLRPKSDPVPEAGLWKGVRYMLDLLTRRPALTATTSIAALVVGVAVLLPVTEATRPGQVPVPAAPLEPIGAEPLAGSGATASAPISPVAAEAETSAEAEGKTNTTIATRSKMTASEEGIAAQMDSAEALADAASAEMEIAPQAEIALSPSANTLSRVPLSPAPAASPMAYDPQPILRENTEAFANAEANPVKETALEPVSTFSTDVDTASYALLRSSLNMGFLPEPDQVRVEEMVNYFPYAYPAPEGAAFSTHVSVMPTPWNAGTQLVTIGLQGALPAMAERPPLNLVFLIDTSGSMEDPNKLGLLKQSLALMLDELRPEDQIAMVTYAGSAGLALAPMAASEKAKILAALDNLTASGGTAGAEGLELAYQIADEMKSEGDVSRILLATDGDFNLGLFEPGELEDFIAKKREGGSYLSVLGFGRGNLDDAVMQALAQKGNGTASYIDTLSEARKVLVDQLTGALFPIADDVKVQVEWNPAQIAEYRLIGYETRALRREDFNNDKVDAGEIGAGLQVTAIYEVTPFGSDAVLHDPLRYGAEPEVRVKADELGYLRLRWKEPGSDTSSLIETPITGKEEASEDSRFAAAIAGFGQLLRGSTYLGDWGWGEAIDLAVANRGADPYGYRSEAVTLMRLAQALDK